MPVDGPRAKMPACEAPQVTLRFLEISDFTRTHPTEPTQPKGNPMATNQELMALKNRNKSLQNKAKRKARRRNSTMIGAVGAVSSAVLDKKVGQFFGIEVSDVAAVTALGLGLSGKLDEESSDMLVSAGNVMGGIALYKLTLPLL